jgi:uncharacterized protein YjeT (DUF2065 family)
MPVILSKLIAVYIAVMGIIFFFNPRALTPYTAFWGGRKRLYIIGGSRILMGLVVLAAAAQCRLKALAAAIGIFLILAGIPYFMIKLDKQKAMVSRWQNRPAIFVRVLGFLILAIGILLWYSA